MIGLLRAILNVLNLVLRQGVDAAQAIDSLRTNADKALAAQASALAAQAAAIEHLRTLIESDSIPTEVGTPTFTPTGGPE